MFWLFDKCENIITQCEDTLYHMFINATENSPKLREIGEDILNWSQEHRFEFMSLACLIMIEEFFLVQIFLDFFLGPVVALS